MSTENSEQPASKMTREVSALEGIFDALHTSMMDSFHAKDFKQSNRMAHQLLARFDTPPLIRGRCHLVLSTAGGDYVWHANEAVRILADLEDQFPTMPKVHLRSARNALKQAYEDEKAKENGELDFLSDDEEAEDEEAEEEEYDLDLGDAATSPTFKDDFATKRDAPVTGKDEVDEGINAASLQSPATKRSKTYGGRSDRLFAGDSNILSNNDAAVGEVRIADTLVAESTQPTIANTTSQGDVFKVGDKTKKVRRIHSSKSDASTSSEAVWQEYDKSQRSWVDLGTANNPMMEGEDDEMLDSGTFEPEPALANPGLGDSGIEDGDEDDDEIL